MSEKIEIENVNTPGRVSRVDKTKYEAMRTALLAALPEQAPGLTHKQIIEAIRPELPQDLWPEG
ncbi:MAG: hypothetical protein AAGL98_05455, partial [Planctomycetota bacterium]